MANDEILDVNGVNQGALIKRIARIESVLQGIAVYCDTDSAINGTILGELVQNLLTTGTYPTGTDLTGVTTQAAAFAQ